jgi:predicted NAD-dependent protein-ADP-ribosyltransferase YbiA (DUF1768 family)
MELSSLISISRQPHKQRTLGGLANIAWDVERGMLSELAPMRSGDFARACATAVASEPRMAMMSNILDIKAKAPFPAGWLSNFAAYPFVIDGVACALMEGCLQSLKAEDREEQRRICGLVGAEAQIAGRRRHDRLSDEYQPLLERAYGALFEQSPKLRRALAGAAEFVHHRSGKSDPCETVLTEAEFCSRLTALRQRLAPDAPAT